MKPTGLRIWGPLQRLVTLGRDSASPLGLKRAGINSITEMGQTDDFYFVVIKGPYLSQEGLEIK